MSENKPGSIIPSKTNMLQELVQRIKLILRLMGDNRVNPLLKLIPIGSLVYFIVPDLLPGPVDDAAVIWLGTYLFVELCPPDVVEEHMNAIRGLPSSSTPPAPSTPPRKEGEEIIEGQFREQ